jgi:hypothetical protein
MRTMSQKEEQSTLSFQSFVDVKCVFSSPDLPCDFCRTRNNGAPCQKKWGQKKEEKKMEERNSKKSIAIARPVATAIDEVIPPQDVLLLQFAYSDVFVTFGGSVVGPLLRRFAVSFSPSINSKPLRHAALALAAAYAPSSEAVSHFERLEYHKSRACKALRKKMQVKIEESDLFAVCLLTVLSALYSQPDFSIHLSGFIAITKELHRKAALEAGSNPLAVFWPLARDMIQSECRRMHGNADAIDFYYFFQQTIGPPAFRSRVRYFSEIFGVGSERLRLYTYVESIWLHTLVLRRCFRDTVLRQMAGQLSTSFIVEIIASEVMADLHSPDITQILDEIAPSHSVVSIQLDPEWGDSFMYTILLHRFCELLIVYLKADSVLKAASTLEANIAASTLVRFLKTEWHVLHQIPQFPAGSLKNQISRSMLPRMLWIAGLTFTKTREPQGMLPHLYIINN